MTQLESLVREQVLICAREFHGNKGELADLPPRFWMSLTNLELAAGDASGGPNALLAALRLAYHQLGAPGDFGYSTPHGEALATLYGLWRKLGNEVRIDLASHV